MAVLGIIYAVIGALFFALYSVPQKLTKCSVYTFSYYLGVGYFVASLFTYLIFVIFGHGEPLFDIWLLVAGVAGVVWYFGQVLYMRAINMIGLSRASTWQKLQGPIASLAILFLFSEYSVDNLVFILLSIFAMGVSGLFLSIHTPADAKSSRVGTMLALLCAFIFASNVIIRKYVTAENLIYSQQLYSSFFIMLTALIVARAKERNFRFVVAFDRRAGLGVLAGVLYFLASFMLILSFEYLLGTVASTLKQLSAIYTLLFGIFLFKEIDFKKHYVRIILGVLCIILSIILLFLCDGALPWSG